MILEHKLYVHRKWYERNLVICVYRNVVLVCTHINAWACHIPANSFNIVNMLISVWKHYLNYLVLKNFVLLVDNMGVARNRTKAWLQVNILLGHWLEIQFNKYTSLHYYFHRQHCFVSFFKLPHPNFMLHHLQSSSSAQGDCIAPRETTRRTLTACLMDFYLRKLTHDYCSIEYLYIYMTRNKDYHWSA